MIFAKLTGEHRLSCREDIPLSPEWGELVKPKPRTISLQLEVEIAI